MMSNQIFISFPVKDLAKSIAFFEALGYTFNNTYSNEDGACFLLNQYTNAMIITHKKWQEFTKKQMVDATKANEVAINTQLSSKAEVDAMIEKGVKAGGKEPRETEDFEFMYSRALEDPDGHTWEFYSVDTSQFPPAQ